MKHLFAALSFSEDENLRGRVYWYRCDFPVGIGDRVIAPVGPHDRMEAARVERVLSAEEKDAPYDPCLIKAVAARYGARKFGEKFLEFGGVRYDKKRYTRFGKLVYGETADAEVLRAYGVTRIWEGADDAFFETFAREDGCMCVLGTAGERIFGALYAFVRGEDDLSAYGVGEETRALLEEKLK